MKKRALEHPNIEFRFHSNVIEANGNEEGMLESITLDSNHNEVIKCSGLFYGIGHEPGELVCSLPSKY